MFIRFAPRMVKPPVTIAKMNTNAMRARRRTAFSFLNNRPARGLTALSDDLGSSEVSTIRYILSANPRVQSMDRTG
jgi:hypothetical protein